MTSCRSSWLPLLACLAILNWEDVPHAQADSWFAPPRPLTESERLSESVGSSHAICHAELIAISDSMRQVSNDSGLSWAVDVRLILKPIAWMKGSFGREPIQAEASGEAVQRIRQAKGHLAPGREVVVFLVATPQRTGHPSDDIWPDPREVPWLLLGGPYGVRGGLIVPAPTDSHVVAEVRAEVARHSLASLATEADVVVVGHPTPGARMEVEAGESFFLSTDVDSVIAGDLAAQTIKVRALLPGDLPSGPTLLFLKRVANDEYFVTRPGGSHAIFRGEVRKLGVSVEAAVAEIRTARTPAGE